MCRVLHQSRGGASEIPLPLLSVTHTCSLKKQEKHIKIYFPEDVKRHQAHWLEKTFVQSWNWIQEMLWKSYLFFQILMRRASEECLFRGPGKETNTFWSVETTGGAEQSCHWMVKHTSCLCMYNNGTPFLIIKSDPRFSEGKFPVSCANEPSFQRSSTTDFGKLSVN